MIYLIGSLRNPRIPEVAADLRAAGLDVFDDWYAAGANADDEWRAYEMGRGRTYPQALLCPAAQHVFTFDLQHLLRATIAVLVQPAGRSAHLELGWMLGKGKRGYVLLESEARWDVMLNFANGVFSTTDQLIARLKGDE